MNSTEYWWDILLFQQILDVIKHVVDENSLPFSNTAHSGWCAQHNSTAAANNSAFFSPELSYVPNSTELNSIIDYNI